MLQIQPNLRSAHQTVGINPNIATSKPGSDFFPGSKKNINHKIIYFSGYYLELIGTFGYFSLQIETFFVQKNAF